MEGLAAGRGAPLSEQIIADPNAKETIKRARKNLAAVNDYNVRYLDGVVKKLTQETTNVDAKGGSANQESTFLNYMRMLTLYAEGKFVSRRADIAQMAKKLASFEYDMACKTQDNVSHYELNSVWKMIEMLDGAIPPSKRPSQVEILRSLAD